MHILNIILFLIYMYGFGYSLTRFEKTMNSEANIMRIAVGLGSFPVVGVLLNFLKIPLDWRIFLILSSAFPIYDLCTRMKFKNILKINIKKPNPKSLCLLLIFAFCIVCYCWGPFTYPWLENDDSWHHAASIKYVALERNLNTASGIFSYINPYPPGYDLLIATLHQTSPSLYWTIKFFNGFIVVWGILFFYFFAKKFIGNDNKALMATFFLASIPCYLSHFIWAHSLVVTLFIPAFYLVLKAKENKRFSLPAGIVIAGIFLTQPTQPIKFMIMLFFLILAIYLVEKRIKGHLIFIPIIGILLSLLWYGPVLKEYRSQKLTLMTASHNYPLKNAQTINEMASGLFNPLAGSTTKVHKIYHYLFPPLLNDRNNPVGIGFVLSFLALLGIISYFHLIKKGNRKERIYAITTLFWLFFTFLGVNSMTFSLPIGLFAYRFWALFAIPVSLMAAEASIEWMSSFNKSFKKIFLIIVVATVLLTSAYPKYITNTYIWAWGVFWNSKREMRGYLSLRNNLKPNTKVFAYTDNLFVIGHDMQCDYWSTRYQKAFKNAIDFDPAKLHNALRENGYEYIIIGEREIRKFGNDVIKQKIIHLKGSNLFELAHEIKNSIWIFKVL